MTITYSIYIPNSTKYATIDLLKSDIISMYKKYKFGLSYDINISRLRPATRGNGAFEVSYVYTLCGVRNRPMGCPTF